MTVSEKEIQNTISVICGNCVCERAIVYDTEDYLLFSFFHGNNVAQILTRYKLFHKLVAQILKLGIQFYEYFCICVYFIRVFVIPNLVLSVHYLCFIYRYRRFSDIILDVTVCNML